MRKKLLVKEAGFKDFFKSFFKAKSEEKESEWLSRVRKINPKVADAFSDYDNNLKKSMQQQYDSLKKLGLDTKHVEDFVDKQGIKIKK